MEIDRNRDKKLTSQLLPILRNEVSPNLAGDTTEKRKHDDEKTKRVNAQVTEKVATEYIEKTRIKELLLARRSMKKTSSNAELHDSIAVDYIIASYAYGRLSNEKNASEMLKKAEKHIVLTGNPNPSRRFESQKVIYKVVFDQIIKERIRSREMHSKLRT
ncbi:MAG: hypothetical protein ACHQX1_02435 [Candidatus Micrarchaeales archaeon]